VNSILEQAHSNMSSSTTRLMPRRHWTLCSWWFSSTILVSTNEYTLGRGLKHAACMWH